MKDVALIVLVGGICLLLPLLAAFEIMLGFECLVLQVTRATNIFFLAVLFILMLMQLTRGNGLVLSTAVGLFVLGLAIFLLGTAYFFALGHIALQTGKAVGIAGEDLAQVGIGAVGCPVI